MGAGTIKLYLKVSCERAAKGLEVFSDFGSKIYRRKAAVHICTARFSAVRWVALA